MNMYAIVKEQEGRRFPAYPCELEQPVLGDNRDTSDIEMRIQTHSTDSNVGLIYRKLETGYGGTVAYCYTTDTDGYDWVYTDEQEVIAEAIRDAKRWLVLERGGWLGNETDES